MAAYTLLNKTQGEWADIIDRAYKALPAYYPQYPCPEQGTVDFAKLIDHTLLKLDATPQQIDVLCEEARKYQFKVGMAGQSPLFLGLFELS